MGACLLAPAWGAIGGKGMSYDGTENDRARFAANQIARLDRSEGLLYDERVLRLMQDPVYLTNWRNMVRAYVQSSSTHGSTTLIASIAMLTLASLDQYERDGAAVDILAAAFQDDDDEDLFKRVYTE
jgi:hypothetical protein